MKKIAALASIALIGFSTVYAAGTILPIKNLTNQTLDLWQTNGPYTTHIILQKNDQYEFHLNDTAQCLHVAPIYAIPSVSNTATICAAGKDNMLEKLRLSGSGFSTGGYYSVPGKITKSTYVSIQSSTD